MSDQTKVNVPNVTGLTQLAAETALKTAGLTVGKVTTAESHSVPAGGVTKANPAEGTPIDRASPVELEISTGQKTDWKEYIPTAIFTLLGLVVLGIIGWGLYESEFLTSISKPDIARSLIAFLIVVVTIGIALILVLSTILLRDSADADRRFDMGKQILTAMIGVLGTIVGFYFGSADRARTPQIPPAIMTAALPDGTVNVAYDQTLQANGVTPPLTWKIAPNLPAGLTLDAKTGKISGTPTTASPKTPYKITVTDSATPPATSDPKEVPLEIKPQR